MILVVAEQRGGTLNRATWETIAAAQQTGQPITIVVLGHGVDAVANDAGGGRRREGHARRRSARWPNTRPTAPCRRCSALIERNSPSACSCRTRIRRATLRRRWRQRVAAAARDRLRGASRERGIGAYVRPVFQGKLQADVVVEGPAPHLVTFQIGAFRADAVKKGSAPAAVEKAGVAIDAAAIRQKPEAPFKEAKQAVDLSQAERIVAVGRGIKGQEHLQLAEQLAQAMGAELAASRPICDAGWLPMDRQIGSSGQTVAPKLYVALGISGAIQHLVGMKGARTIVAINKDAEAPIFEIADYGIVGDLFEIVPAMIAELKK